MTIENWGSFKGGLYGPGMHDYIYREIELGERVARCIDDKDALGWDAIDDLIYLRDMKEQEKETDECRSDIGTDPF